LWFQQETLQERLRSMATASNKIIITDNNGQRELSGQELTDFLAQQVIDKADSDALKAAAEAKATAKAALLTQLGITAEQARLLLS